MRDRTWRTPGGGMGCSRQQAATRVLAGLLIFAVACTTGIQQQPSAMQPAQQAQTAEPLGWGGPVEAPEVRSWSTEALEEAPRWTIADAHVGVLTPDTLRTQDGRSVQRSVRSGVILPAGQLVLAVSVPSGPTEVVTVETPLVPVLNRGGRDQEAPSPTGDRVEPRTWAEGGRVVLLGDEAGRLTRGPEWLVFDPAGELVARMEIPRNLTVLAFGAASVLATAANEAGRREVGLYGLNKSQ